MPQSETTGYFSACRTQPFITICDNGLNTGCKAGYLFKIRLFMDGFYFSIALQAPLPMLSAACTLPAAIRHILSNLFTIEATGTAPDYMQQLKASIATDRQQAPLAGSNL